MLSPTHIERSTSFSGELKTGWPDDPERSPSPVSPAQIRGARAMLGWSKVDLSRAARVSVSTVKRLEDARSDAVTVATAGMIRNAFELEGVRFLPDDGNGPGLRRREST